MVQGDRTLLTRGYGYADWAERSPVIPDETQFRIASITKTFTATAVAQLLERGLIKSLDDPANMYLKRTQLAQSFGEDVTVWDLLTHRAGYEDSSLGRGAFGHELPLVPEVIAAATPQIVRKRDTVSVYSNFGVSILGIMIEDITGQLMEDYLRENIFQPLGMTNSLLMDGPERAPNLVTPYNFTEDGSARGDAVAAAQRLHRAGRVHEIHTRGHGQVYDRPHPGRTRGRQSHPVVRHLRPHAPAP